MTLEQAINIRNCDIDITTGERITHEEKYTRAINFLGGLEAVIPYIPFTLEEITESLPQDEHLNNLPLKTWDVGVGLITYWPYHLTTRDKDIIISGKQLMHLCRAKRINISAAQGVCILKEAARQWAEREVTKCPIN